VPLVATLAALAAATLALTSCAGSPGASSASSSGSSAPIIIGLSSDPTALSPLVAAQEGFFQNHGLNVTTKLFTSAGDALTAAVSGSVQLAGTVSDLTLLGTKAKGADVQAIAVLDSTGKQVGLVGDADIKGPQDLVGKTVGMTAGVAAQFYQVLYFNKYGLNDSTTKVVNIAAPDTVAALAGNNVQAFFGFEPWLGKASSAVPGAHVVSYSGDDNIYPLKLALAGTSTWIAANPKEASAAIDAISDAATWISQNKDAAIKIASDAYHVDIPTATTLVNNQDYTVQSPSQLTDIYTQGATFLNAQNVVTIPDVNGLVTQVVNTTPFDNR
jgi:NitT/TauT family transport system substrate-binding protein